MSTNPPPHVAQAAAVVDQWLNQTEGRKSQEDYERTSPAERFAYCRQFDQSKMPTWNGQRS